MFLYFYNNICFYIFIITYVLHSLSSYDSVHSFPYKTSKFSEKISKDPRKVQFLFSDEQKLISHFSRIFLLFFDHIRNYSHPFHQIVSIKNYQIILQNRKFHIFLRKSRIWRMILLFLKKISRISNKLLKSSSKNAFFVFDIAIFHFLEDLFINLRDFYFSFIPKKRVISLHMS